MEFENATPNFMSIKDDDVEVVDLRVPRRLTFDKESETVSIETTKYDSSTLPKDDLLLASVLVKDARYGRNISFKTDSKSIRLYILFNHPVFKILLFMFLWANLLLAIFEKPSIPELELPYWATMIMEVTFLSYFLLRWLHHLSFQQQIIFWKDPKNLTVIATIILTAIDMLSYITWVNVDEKGETDAIRWSRVVRPLFLINFPEGRQIRNAFRNIRRTLPDIFYVLVLFILSIALFSLMAFKVFELKNLTYPDGSPYFQDYFDGFWDLYVLVTTANNPDIMMPAYDDNGWFSLFFIIYLMINLYVFMSIVLAVIYNNYRRNLKNEVRSQVYIKRRLLSRVFNMLKTVNEDVEVVNQKRWNSLMSEVIPNKSQDHYDIMWSVLVNSANQGVERKDFLKVADLLNVPLTEVKEEATFFEKHFPSIYLSLVSFYLIVVVKNRFFHYFFDFAILINAICIVISYDEIEWLFLFLFTMEILLKLYAYGFAKFFKSYWNIFDFIVIGSALIATIYEAARGQTANTEMSTLQFILVLRVLRLVRLMNAIPKFRVTLTTIVDIGPSFITFGGVIFVIFYIYAMIGMEAFQGRIRFYGYEETDPSTKYCGDMRLKGSEFYIKHYCKNNFNSFGNSLVTLFELMVVNQWHVLTSGYVTVTNKAARIYFISFHLIVVVILVNIFTAFVLEVFLLEYSLSANELEASIEKKIKDMGLGKHWDPVDGVVSTEDPENKVSDENSSHTTERPTFKLRKRGTKAINVLLQHMFEGEIEETDEGPDNLLDSQEGFSYSKFHDEQ